MESHGPGVQPPSPEPCDRCRRMRKQLVLRLLEKVESNARPVWRCPACGRRWATDKEV
jgi:rubrerythrin